jgi:Flp pilus assembly pilin Flp
MAYGTGGWAWNSTVSAFDNARFCRHHGCLAKTISSPEGGMAELIRSLWWEDQGQDIAEYAVMLAVILVLVVGTIRLIGTNANTAFSNVASSIQ